MTISKVLEQVQAITENVEVVESGSNIGCEVSGELENKASAAVDEYEYEDPHIVAGFDQMRMFQTPKTSYGSDAGQNKVPTKKISFRERLENIQESLKDTEVESQEAIDEEDT